MTLGGEAAHVGADLGDDDARAQVADPRDGGQQPDRDAKGFDVVVHLLVDPGDGGVQGIDLLEMQAQQKAMMPRHPATQRFAQHLGRCLDPPVGERRQSIGIGLAADQGLDHRPAGQADDIGDHRIELDVGIFQRLLQPLDMAGPLADQLLAGAQQPAHLLGLGIRHEAAPDQPMRQQIGQPSRIVDVRLAAGDVLHMGRVRQQQFEFAVAENMPDRLPVHPGRLHDDVGAALRGQPFRQLEKRLRRRLERAHLASSGAVHRRAQARHHRVLMHVETGATRIQNLHLPPPGAPPRVGSLLKEL